MKRLTRALISALVLLNIVFCGGSFTSPIPVNADNIPREQAADLTYEKKVFDEIIAHKLAEAGASNIQEWADNDVADGAGQSMDWYAYLLAENYPGINLEKYTENLLDYIENNKSGAVSEQKYALCIMAAESESERALAYLAAVCDRTIGKQGVMSLIYGLKLLDCGLPCSTFTKDSVIDELLSLRLDDGGWAVFGAVSDVDVTAMCLQSLAGHTDREEVSDAVAAALKFLANRQEEDGGFKSFGLNNPESAAQVMIALSELSFDYRLEESFIKNGSTIFDAILKFQTTPGMFSHEQGKEANFLATLQTAMACSSYIKYQGISAATVPVEEVNGRSEEEEIDTDSYECESEQIESGSNKDNAEELNQQESESQKSADNTPEKLSAKAVIMLIIAGLTLASLVVCAVKHRKWKSYVFSILVGAAALLILANADIQGISEYYETPETENQITIKLKIDTSVVGNPVSESTEIDLPNDATAYSALIALAKEKKLQVEATGSGMSIYIKGIDYLYEFDYGDLSGWMYEVNGVQPSVGSAAYTLSDGDEVVWFYTKSMGHDR